MTKCPNCGHEIPEGVDTCPSCLSRLRRPETAEGANPSADTGTGGAGGSAAGGVLSTKTVEQSGLRSATFDVTVTNKSAGVVRWTPMGSAPDDVDVAVEPSPVEVRPGAPASVRVMATAAGLNWGSAREHRITVGGPKDVINNRLELVFAQKSVFWPALAGVVAFMLLLVVAFNAFGGGTGETEDPIAAATTTTTAAEARSTTTTNVSTTAASTTSPSTTATPTTVPPTTAPDSVPEGDLGIEGHEMVAPPCDDVYITVLFSAIQPDAYEQQVSSRLDAHPGSRYLRTDQSCSSLRQSINGNPIYAVFLGPFDTADEACDSLADDSSYVRLLSNTTPSGEATVDCS